MLFFFFSLLCKTGRIKCALDSTNIFFIFCILGQDTKALIASDGSSIGVVLVVRMVTPEQQMGLCMVASDTSVNICMKG